MTIRFRCPSGHQLSVDDQLAGQKIRCGECRKIALVPSDVGIPGARQEERLPPQLGGEGAGREPREVQRSTSAVLRRPLRLMPRDVYRADGDVIRAAWGLAVILVVAVAFSLIPVVRLGHLNPETAPGWARVAVLIATLQLVYVIWMVNAPDWASVWVVMLVFALVATAYAVATAVALATPAHHPLMLGMGEVRQAAAKWCGAVLGVMCVATYLCGRLSTQWNRSYRQEIEQGGRRRSTRKAAKGRLLV